MGFKDLAKFNEVILAKQVWRLYTDRTSLFFKVFSAKFFTSSSVFDEKSLKGSFAWVSSLKARTVIKKGMLCRISDGKQVHLFHDLLDS